MPPCPLCARLRTDITLSEREKTLRWLDEAIELTMASMRSDQKLTGDAECDALNADIHAKKRAELAKSLTGMLERRSKLLGLDAQPGTESAPQPATEQPLDRIMRVVPGKAGGA